MKRKLLILFVSLVGTFSAIQAQNSVSEFAGQYKGDLYVVLDPTQPAEPVPNQTVDMEIGELPNTINFALHNFSFMELPLGDILLPSIPISKAENGKGIFGENAPVSLMFMGGAIEATAQLNIEKSYTEGDSLIAKIDVIWTNGGNLPIDVLFKGKKIQTSISSTVADKTKGNIYTTSGILVRSNTTETKGLPKGLYIVNKKTIVVN